MLGRGISTPLEAKSCCKEPNLNLKDNSPETLVGLPSSSKGLNVQPLAAVTETSCNNSCPEVALALTTLPSSLIII